MNKLACIFPGQGSQSVGMGLDLYQKFDQVRDIFDQMDLMFGVSLSKLCFEGPNESLKRTINTQPAILAVSLAAWSVYLSQGGQTPSFVAGHSLGEISALVAAGALTMKDAATLVKKRAHLMEECPAGAMSAVIGVAAKELEKCCREVSEQLRLDGASDQEAIVLVANFNTKDQLVISGSPTAVSKAGMLAKKAGGRVIPLPVGGAFHSPLMVPAAESFSLALADLVFENSTCQVVQNFDGLPSTRASEIKNKLGQQMDHPVLWCSSVEYMISQGVDTFVEIGPGNVLAGTIKKIDPAVRIFNASDAENLQSTLDALKQLVGR